MRKYSSREIRKLACLYFQRQESDDSLGLEERLCSGTNEIRLEPYPEDWNRVTHTKHALRERVFRWNQIESHRCVFKRLRQHSFAGHRARHRRAKPLASRVNHASAGKQTGRHGQTTHHASVLAQCASGKRLRYWAHNSAPTTPQHKSNKLLTQ